jgi:hypothetical protein
MTDFLFYDIIPVSEIFLNDYFYPYFVKHIIQIHMQKYKIDNYKIIKLELSYSHYYFIKLLIQTSTDISQQQYAHQTPPHHSFNLNSTAQQFIPNITLTSNGYGFIEQPPAYNMGACTKKKRKNGTLVTGSSSSI